MVTRLGSSFTFVAPSGARIWVTSAGIPFRVETMASQIRFAGSSYSRGFQIGGRGYHDDAQRDVLVDAELVSRLLTADRREVRVSRSGDRNTSMASLIGEHHEVMTVFAGPAPSADRVLGVFDSVDIRDSAQGMTVRPRAASMVSTVSEVSVLICSGFADLSIGAASPGVLPGWRGTVTQHGQVWRSNRPDQAGRSAARAVDYVLDYPTARVDLSPTPTGVDDDALLDWVDALHVQRQPAR